MRTTCTVFILVLSIGGCLSDGGRIFLDIYGKVKTKPITADLDGPLILTPLIEANKIEEAQTASKINFNEFGNVTSYSGYFTVDKTYNSNLFFWYFPPIEEDENSPVILWLQGGPGASSLFGLFGENGPFQFSSDGELELREVTWVRSSHVIYIDSPAGTGFSFTDGGFANNQTKVGKDLYSALHQFFTMFPDLQKRNFFVTGESYGGKYVPAVSYTIFKKNPDADLKINLQGLAIGNGLSDPLHQIRYANRLYELGFIDQNRRKVYDVYEQQIFDYILGGNPQMAYYLFTKLILGGGSLFYNDTLIPDVYNFVNDNGENGGLGPFLDREDVREAIHVGNTTYSNGQVVYDHLQYDIPLSVAPWIEELIEEYPILFYNGQLDLLVPYPPTVEFLRELQWSGADDYKKASRRAVIFQNDVVGYVKQTGNLLEFQIRNAGHMVPADQPMWAYQMIYEFTRSRSL